MNSTKVRTYGEDTRPAKEPFTFRVAGSAPDFTPSPEFTVTEPDAGTVMDIEEAKTSRQVLKLFLGEQYTELEEYLEPKHPDALVDLAQDMSRHFGLFDVEAASNRATRRRRDRGRR